MATVFTKSKSSTLAKIAALPRYRSPKDLLNQPHLPYDLQLKQIHAQVSQPEGQYLSEEHFKLCHSSALLRQQFRASQAEAQRSEIAAQHLQLWNGYLSHWMSKPEMELSDLQKQRVYEAMLTAKERNEQRLALNRFVKFGYEYSQAFRVDIPLNPVVLMKIVHPHFGYLNNIPNESQFKYTYQQIFVLLSELMAASQIREQGYTLHSSEMLSFIFWKIMTQNRSMLSIKAFLDLVRIFKFDLTPQTYQAELGYSIQEGEVIEKEGKVRFDVLREIFLDRNI